MNRQTMVLIGSGVVFVAMLFLMNASNSNQRSRGLSNEKEPLLVFCAASNRVVMESIRIQYEKEFSRSVQIQYGASQTLLSNIEVSGSGDLYLPADDSFVEMGRDKGLLSEVFPLATMNGVVAVRRGNPKNIQSFSDLIRPEIRLVQASPDAAAIGKRTKLVLGESKLWERLEAATVAFRTTVIDVGNDVVINAADAGIVYDAVMKSYPDLETIQMPEFQGVVSSVSLAVVTGSKQPQSALHFARYVAAKDRGLVHYAEQGFQVTAGDTWSDQPELSIFAGSMLRPAIEETLIAFEKREGIRVTRVYNGCGVLVAQMKAGQHPDAYFACDTEFMSQVPDLFPKPVDVSMNELVILVKKGNPLDINTLRDLTKKGVRVGIGHEKQCAMGWLTQNTLRQGGLQKEVMENVTVQSPTGDMLVNQMQAGALDAAVAYLSNAAGSAEHLDAIPIVGLSCSLATQPFAVAERSPNAQLADRLFRKICSAESKETFEAEGFRWRDPLPLVKQITP